MYTLHPWYLWASCLTRRMGIACVIKGHNVRKLSWINLWPECPPESPYYMKDNVRERFEDALLLTWKGRQEP